MIDKIIDKIKMSTFDNISNPDIGNFSDLNFTNLMDNGLLWQGFAPFITAIGEVFWGALLGIIAITVYNYKRDAKLALGFLMAMILITSAIIPAGWIDLFSLILGLCITGLLYEVFVITKRKKGGRK